MRSHGSQCRALTWKCHFIGKIVNFVFSFQHAQHATTWTNSCNGMTHGVMQVNRCPDWYIIENMFQTKIWMGCPEGTVQIFTYKEPSSFETLGSQFSVLGDVPNSDFGSDQSPSSIGFWSHPKSESSGTKSPDPDPRESQICLLGGYKIIRPIMQGGGPFLTQPNLNVFLVWTWIL